MNLKKYLPPLVMWIIFETIAVALWFTLDNIFYLFNFSYIGTAIAVGLVLYQQKKKYARNVVQFAVGMYMLYACVLGVSLSGKYADRRILVLSFPRRI